MLIHIVTTSTRPTIALNADFLREVGLGSLPPAVANRLLARTYEAIEMDTGRELAERMSEEEIDELDALIELGDERATLAWLTEHRPDYPDVVAASFEALRAQLTDQAGRILARVEDLGAQDVTFDVAPDESSLTEQAS